MASYGPGEVCTLHVQPKSGTDPIFNDLQRHPLKHESRLNLRLAVCTVSAAWRAKFELKFNPP